MRMVSAVRSWTVADLTGPGAVTSVDEVMVAAGAVFPALSRVNTAYE